MTPIEGKLRVRQIFLLTVVVVSAAVFMPILLSILRRAVCSMTNTYVAGTHSMAFVTVPDMEVGKKLAHGLVKEKLAACVNIIPQITSVYEWEDKVNEDPELLLDSTVLINTSIDTLKLQMANVLVVYLSADGKMIKTLTSKVDDVSKYVRENHPYDVAEVISSLIDNGNEPYLKWITDTVGHKSSSQKKD